MNGRDPLLDHYHRPRNRGTLPPPALVNRGVNALCGDDVVISIALSEDRAFIQDVQFDGRGCSILLASASMLTELAHGRSIADAEAFIAEFVRSMGKPGFPPMGAQGGGDGDVDALRGVKMYPSRIKCALLPWSTLLALFTAAEAPEVR